MEINNINCNELVVELKVTQEKLKISNKKILETQDELRKSDILLSERDISLKHLTDQKHDLIVKLSVKEQELLFLQEALRQAKNAITEKKTKLIFPNILINVIYLISTVFVGIGVNWLTSTPPISLGWIMIFSSAILYLVAVLMTSTFMER